MFIVLLTYQRPLPEIDGLMRRHVVWLKRHYATGLFIASGRRVPRSGGVILARSGDEEALRAALGQDPFVVNGAATFELIEFTPSMTVSGQLIASLRSRL